jgi:hypothetical protein
MVDREGAGREVSPSAAVIDSQSIKAPQAKTKGYDAGKKIVGRKLSMGLFFGLLNKANHLRAEKPQRSTRPGAVGAVGLI